MILFERLGQVLVHLGLNTLLSIPKHGMSCKCDDWSSLGTKTPLILSDLGSSFKSTLNDVSTCKYLSTTLLTIIGICTSIRMTSYLFSLIASRASWPLPTT